LGDITRWRRISWCGAGAGGGDLRAGPRRRCRGAVGALGPERATDGAGRRADRAGGASGKAPRYKYTRGLARNLLKVWPALWTFADHRAIEPTNNHAERALRSAVIYRKLSLGTQSDGGERRIERLLSAHTTCRLQRRSLHAYLTDAIGAHARGDPAPLLA
jgi:hypothetical protein